MRNTRMSFFALIIIFPLGSLAGPTEDFATLLDEHWEWTLASNPTMASSLGDKRYNDRWSDQSLDATAERRKQAREFLRRVYAIDRTALSSEDQLNYELFRRSLQDAVDEFQFDGHLLPFYQRGGECKTSTT